MARETIPWVCKECQEERDGTAVDESFEERVAKKRLEDEVRDLVEHAPENGLTEDFREAVGKILEE